MDGCSCNLLFFSRSMSCFRRLRWVLLPRCQMEKNKHRVGWNKIVNNMSSATHRSLVQIYTLVMRSAEAVHTLRNANFCALSKNKKKFVKSSLKSLFGWKKSLTLSCFFFLRDTLQIRWLPQTARPHWMCLWNLYIHTFITKQKWKTWKIKCCKFLFGVGNKNEILCAYAIQ